MKFKAILLSLIFFLSFSIVSLTSFAGDTFKYVWNNTYINVPINSAIDDYKNLPVATLYRNGTALTDANITYNTEGDWLYYFKNINTAKPGDYKVWYKAYENKYIPGTCTDYKSLITFHVVDNIKPTIEVIESTLNVVRGGSLDLSSNVVVKDNYTESPTINFSENIDYNKVGTYPVLVKAIDLEGNYETKEFDVVVYDDAKEPTITCSEIGSIIKVPYNSDYNIKEYFTAIDYKDGDISGSINYPPLKTDSLGSYSYTVSVKNSAELYGYLTVTIEVVDDEAPVLILTKTSEILDYTLDFSTLDYNKYIRSLTDNVEINYENLNITYNMENKVGSYNIYFSYTDGIYTVSDTIDVSLISYQAPKIEVSDIEIKESSNINYLDYIKITDDSDSNILESVKIYDDNVDYESEGTYYASVYCMNSSGLSNEVEFKVIITSESVFSKANKGFSISTFVMGGIIIILIGIMAGYIIIKRKKKV